MKMLALIFAMLIFFAFALQNAVKDMTYSHSTSQVQKGKTTTKSVVNIPVFKILKRGTTKTVAVK